MTIPASSANCSLQPHVDSLLRSHDLVEVSTVSWAEFAANEPEMAARGRQLLYRHGDGEGLLATVAGDGPPRVHPMNVGVVGDRLLVFVQSRSAKAKDLATDGRYALHAHQDPSQPHEFLVRAGRT